MRSLAYRSSQLNKGKGNNMAMNKKEQAQLQEAIDAAVINRALRWSDYEIHPDIPVPVYEEGFVNGWSFNSHTGIAYKSWSSSVLHGNSHVSSVRPPHASQKGIKQYSSQSLALKAMRRDMEKRFAHRLASVDQMIKVAEGEGQ